MAPEQAAGRTKFVGPAADVYALGAILYQCLTGAVPFTGADSWEVINKVAQEPPRAPRELNPALDPDLEAVCLKCLEKSPHDRYPSAGALAADLQRHLRGEPVSARPPGFADWFRQLWRTRPTPSAYAGPPVLIWFGVIMLTAHSVVFGLAAAGGPMLAVWIALIACAGSAAVVVWWYLLRRFRRLIMTERHSAVVAIAHIIAQTALLVTLPTSPTAPASGALAYYTPLTALSGMGLFVIGSTHWGRFVLFGLFVLGLVPVMHWLPAAAPLLYGAVMAAIMWYWAYSVGVTFARAPAPGPAPPARTAWTVRDENQPTAK
jgi:serine/threonine-protein kinase